MPTTVRAVIFDLDDTLFDHGESVRTALTRWLPQVASTDLNQVTKAWFDLEHMHYDSWRAGHISFDEQRRRRIRDFWPHLSSANSPLTKTSTHCSPPTSVIAQGCQSNSPLTQGGTRRQLGVPLALPPYGKPTRAGGRSAY